MRNRINYELARYLTLRNEFRVMYLKIIIKAPYTRQLERFLTTHLYYIAFFFFNSLVSEIKTEHASGSRITFFLASRYKEIIDEIETQSNYDANISYQIALFSANIYVR